MSLKITRLHIAVPSSRYIFLGITSPQFILPQMSLVQFEQLGLWFLDFCPKKIGPLRFDLDLSGD